MQEIFNETFGAQIRLRRGKRKRWEIAALAGLSPDTIGRYERGEGSPSLVDAKRIADALDCRLAELLPPADEEEGAA